MVRIATKLSNLYTPTPLLVDDSKNGSDDPEPTRDGALGDATSGPPAPPEQRRRRRRRPLLRMQSLLRHQQDGMGAVLVELGHTTVVCYVHGPLTATSPLLPASSLMDLSVEHGTLCCTVKLAMNTATLSAASSHVTSLDRNSNNNAIHKTTTLAVTRQESMWSAQLHTAMAAAVPLQQYAKCAILVHVTVLHHDHDAAAAIIIPAMVTAASLALQDAGLELYDLVACCHVVRTPDQQQDIVVDPTPVEWQNSTDRLTMALLPAWKEVTLWEEEQQQQHQQLHGSSSSSGDSAAKVNALITAARQGCQERHAAMRSYLIAK